MKIVLEQGEILSNLEVAPGIFLLNLRLPQIARIARPGQFIHLRIAPLLDPLLRRPFSIHLTRPEEAMLSLLYQTVGKGTNLLSQKHPGERLDCLGPLGNAFAIPEGKGECVLVAGGIGIAPLTFLAQTLSARKNTKVRGLIGAVSGEYILYEREFRSWGVEVEVATDDGSKGHRGPVTDLLLKRMEGLGDRGHIFACGPERMLAEVARIALQQEIPCQVSLEQRMACGVGACQGCVVKTRSGYRRVCTDGPVFDAREVSFS